MRTVHTKIAAALLLLPPVLGGATAHAADLVETAEQRGRFGTLLRALRAAGVADTLAAEGPFTLFAPTDEAFANLPEGLLESLLAGDDERLERLLAHHVVAGRAYPSNDLPVELEPLAGGPLVVDFRSGALTLRNAADQGGGAIPDPDDLGRRTARVVIGDIEADNGIIHAVDAVLVPPDLARAPATGREAPATAEAAEGPAAPEAAAAPPEPEEVSPDGAPEIEPAEAPPAPGEVAPVGVPVEPEAVTAAERLAAEAATAATARRPGPEAVEAGAAAEPAEPEAETAAAEPAATGEEVEPDVAVEPAEPEVIVERGEPDVTVIRPGEAPEAPGADVAVEAVEPAVTVERPEPPAAEPAADEPAEAEVAVVEPTDEPRPAAEEPEADVAAVEPAEGEPEPTAIEPEPAEPEEAAEVEVEEPTAAPGPEAAAPATPPTRVDVASFDGLMGRTVRSRRGEEAGEVEDVVFVRATGEIELVVVDFGGFLGLFEKAVAVPWRDVGFDAPDGDLVVDLSAEEIEAAPEFDYDDLNEALYRAHVGPRAPAG